MSVLSPVMVCSSGVLYSRFRPLQRFTARQLPIHPSGTNLARCIWWATRTTAIGPIRFFTT